MLIGDLTCVETFKFLAQKKINEKFNNFSHSIEPQRT